VPAHPRISRQNDAGHAKTGAKNPFAQPALLYQNPSDSPLLSENTHFFSSLLCGGWAQQLRGG
jgi:hypothetical protein